MFFRKRLFTSTSAIIVKLNDISLTLDIREVIVVFFDCFNPLMSSIQ